MGVMKTATFPPADRAVLDRLLDPLTRRLTPAAARALVGFRADSATRARISELAEKCNEGELTSNERAEYEAYVCAADLITVLQSKARQLLKSRKP
jgi:phage tail sheath gpL-like